MDFLKFTKGKILIFLIFAFLGFLNLFYTGTRSAFIVSDPQNASKPFSLDRFRELLPANSKICTIDSYYETYYPGSWDRFYNPISGIYYGKICNKLILYALNLPYYYLLTVFGVLLFQKFPLQKQNKLKNTKIKSIRN